ncbi:MAG TPA: CHAT domain-containing tetratricopeptide repeat protein [Thermoanaerobaculia bacterium]|jgi:CHAT domain-containing protein/Tfp pilus assembly protein PilF|nr:CHAT domain-containing tetratricopeptide repeat protein [Thermoanaerobaculia bacterium]
MPSRLVPVRGRGLCGLAAVVLSTLLAAALQAEAPRPEETLPPGEVRERPIKSDEAQAWRVTVTPGTALLVTVDQHSIALVAEARGPEGQALIAVHAGDRWGPEVLLLETAGEFRIEVRPRDLAVWPGKYTIRTEALPAGKSARRDALALMSRAGQETVPDTADSKQRAVAIYRQALAAWRSLGERAWEAQTLFCLANLEAEASDLQPATENFLAGLKLWRELREPHREAETLNRLGLIYRDTQGIAKAREPLENALSLWHGLGERFDEAQTRGNLCLLELGEEKSLPAALAGLQENLAFFHGLGAEKQEEVTLHNIGAAYSLLGEPDKALDSYQSALAICHALGDRYGEAETLNNIASVHRALGEWQEALRIYDRVRIVLASLGDRDLDTALLNNTAFIYNNLGEPERALPYFEKALKLRREVGNRKAEVTSLNNLGSARRRLGDLKQALGEHRQALALAASLGDVVQQAASRLRLAEVRLDQGDASAALRDLDAALALLREKGNRRTETEVLHLQGRALTLAGRAREALPALQEVLVRRRAVRDRAGEAETLYALAVAERSLGLAAEARSHAEASVAQVEELRIGFASPDLRASFLATRQRAFSLLIDLLMDQDTAEPGRGHDREAFSVSERARARSLLDALRGANAGSAAPAELLARRRVLLRRQNERVDQRWKQSGAGAEALEKEIDSILTEIDAVEAEIRRNDLRPAAFSTPQPAGPTEISGWLEPDTMLLEYSLGEDRSFLWAVEAGRIRSFVLPRRNEIETLVRQVYEELSTVESGSARRGVAAEALSQALLGPVWSSATQLHRLVVVPDGELGILPFAALPVPDPGRSWKAPGAHKPVLEHLEVVSIPSATTLAVQRQRLEHRAPAAKWAAILADPVFAPNDPRLAHRPAAVLPVPGKATAKVSPLRGTEPRDVAVALERLPSTRREAQAVASLAPTGQVWTGLGVEANRDAVLSGELRDFRILHFATHAVADTRNPELSGLMLSQVDAEGRSREGFLGLSDIYELNLDADLVVLSGCRTALGKEVRGEGLMGLTRGFQYAGVPRVVATLWRVQDRTTAELMTRFYRAMWRDHLPPAAALREAQRSLRREPRYRDPYSWASFVLQGDWH